MSKLLAILIILAWPLSAWAGVTYYVSNANPAGSDSDKGTSPSTPWLTIAKVNSSKFEPGDSILFNSGCTWREQLTVPSSGNSGNPITFGAYGNGAAPIINGADIVTGWTLSTGSIYTYTPSWNAGITLQDDSPLTLQTWNTNVTTTFSGASPGSFSVNPSTNEIYIWMTDSANPSSHTVEVSHRQFGITATNTNYITINGLTVYATSIHGIAGNSLT
ncbi:MAG: hypothetical protein ACLQBD_26265 [Syntrophobacteraceae bacterium]